MYLARAMNVFYLLEQPQHESTGEMELLPAFVNFSRNGGPAYFSIVANGCILKSRLVDNNTTIRSTGLECA